MPRAIRRLCAVAPLVLGSLGLIVGAGCGGPEPTDDPDAGSSDVIDAADTEETGEADGEVDGTDAEGTIPAPGILCDPCSVDADCGASDDQCVTLGDEASVCATSCDPSASSPCPDRFRCAILDQDDSTGQCIPEQLTCKKRCEGVECGEGRRCNPVNGECEEPLGYCDNGCRLDAMCGDGPEDRCLPLAGTENPREQICTTTCNPELEDPGCPVDFACAALEPDEDPTAGICYPLERTCVDRCSDTTCGEGENCNLQTGQCEEAQYSACQKGCTSNAQCGDQDDWCLNLAIGEGSHCWLGCDGGARDCPDNYSCNQLRGTTVNICIPDSMRCDECYGASCLPGGACNPETGQCETLDCRETGCPSGEACDPRSTSCVEVGRSCSGGSWADDCDNIATGCTSRRSGIDGTCARICSSGADCGSGTSCVSTNYEDFCLEENLGGPQTCGTLHRAGTDVGSGCSSSSDCSGSAPTCIEGGGIDGFCSRTCTSDSDCSADQICTEGPTGSRVCVPVQCRCAAGLGAGNAVQNALHTALGSLGIDLCEVRANPSEALSLEEVGETPLAAGALADWLEFPVAGIHDAASAGEGLETANDAPEVALESAADAAGVSISSQAGSYSFSGQNSKLTQAASELFRAAGQTPPTSKLKSKAQNVPSGFQDVAAPIVMAVADAYRAREQALQSIGWGSARRSEAFAGAPYLFLPGTQSQTSGAPDLSQQNVLQDYRDVPTPDMAKAAADLAATISDARAKASNRSSWTGFSYVVKTDAGKIVLGDATNSTYDPSSNGSYGGDIAVLVDAGGDDTYRVAAGANTSVSNGAAVAVDLGGEDTYSYEKAGDALDTQYLLGEPVRPREGADFNLRACAAGGGPGRDRHAGRLRNCEGRIRESPDESGRCGLRCRVGLRRGWVERVSFGSPRPGRCDRGTRRRLVGRFGGGRLRGMARRAGLRFGRGHGGPVRPLRRRRLHGGPRRYER
jgi:hypothetical protein